MFKSRLSRIASQFSLSNKNIVWGNARLYDKSLIRIEDGFIRSIEPTKNDYQLSICVDDLGIYYEAESASRFQELLKIRDKEFSKLNQSTSEIDRAKLLIKSWQTNRISKYNNGREINPPEDPFVLVIDQTLGDRSISGGLANSSSFCRMIDAALSEYPYHKVAIKIHPDVAIGKKKGIINLSKYKNEDRVIIVPGHFHPVSLIEASDAVFVVTSQIGFESLIWGKHTRVFGMPFYGGLGLTVDDIAPPNSRAKTSKEALMHVSLIDYVLYCDPETDRLTNPENIINWVAMQRSNRNRFPKEIHLHNVSWRKRKVLRVFLQGSNLKESSELNPIEEKSPLYSMTWGTSQVANDYTLTVEDGFIRSKGLSPDQYFPYSLVVDSLGIHYDYSRPSELEEIIKNKEELLPLIDRAKKLRELIVKNGITKYNLSEEHWRRPKDKDHIILVIGQVPSDASIKFGAIDIKSDLELLNTVRKERPGQYLVYKPHPDIEAGIRKSLDHSRSVKLLSNEVVSHVDMNNLFSQIDELHTITSLTGFEALLRGVKTFCYGMPFYAGWGLTIDRHSCYRRNVTRTIDELVAAALIKYPIYIDKKSRRYTTPENIISRILYERKNQKILIKNKLARFFTGIYNMNKFN